MQQQWFETASKTFEANIAALTELSEKNAKTAQELFDKRVDCLKGCFDSSQEKVKELAAAKDFPEFVAAQSDLMVECCDKVFSNYNELLSVTADAQSELTKLAESAVAEMLNTGESAAPASAPAKAEVPATAEATPVAAAPAAEEAKPAPAAKKPAAKRTRKTS